MSEVIDSSSISILSDLELRMELTRHGIEVGPIVPSTRKVYEKKLQILTSGNEGVESGENLVNGAMNGGSGTPLRETTPLMNAGSNSSPKPTPRSTPAPNEQGSDDDDEPSESARILTPREMRNFHRSFKSMDSPDSFVLRQRRECSPQLGDINPLCATNGVHGQQLEKSSSSAVKRFGCSFLVVAMTVALIAGMFWVREHILPIFDNANDVEKGQ